MTAGDLRAGRERSHGNPHHAAAERPEVALDLVEVDHPLGAHAVDDGAAARDERLVAVLLQSVEGRAGGPTGVEAPAGHDHELVGELKHALGGGLEHARAFMQIRL